MVIVISFVLVSNNILRLVCLVYIAHDPYLSLSPVRCCCVAGIYVVCKFSRMAVWKIENLIFKQELQMDNVPGPSIIIIFYLKKLK